MIEVVFGASEADSLKMSPLHTQADEILCMEPGLDVGEIRGLEDGISEKERWSICFGTDPCPENECERI